jgi:spore coat protein E
VTREIITKAVCGVGDKCFQYARVLRLPEDQSLSRILGTAITRVTLPEPREMILPTSDDLSVPVGGSFDINVWYSYNDRMDTAVLKDRVTVSELLPMTMSSPPAGNEVKARLALTQHPECTFVDPHGDGAVRVGVRFELRAEVIAETKVAVQVAPD